MINPAAIAEGAMAGVAAKAAIDMMQPDPNHQESVIQLLTKILDAVSPQEKQQFDIPLLLQPYPYEYVIDPNWMGKPHLCILFAAATPIRFDIDGVGTYLKTIGPGWVQCDARGRLSTTDAQSHGVMISYRDEEIGGIFL